MKRFLSILGTIFLSLLVLLGLIHFSSRTMIAILTRQALGTPLFQEVEYVSIGSHQLAFRRYNEGHDKTVVMIHGFMGSSYEYHEFFTAMAADNDFNIIAFDTMGFGFSDKPLDFEYTSQNHALTFIAALDQLGIDQFSLMGHSMGGGIAIRMALMMPSRVDDLVLIAATGPTIMGPSESAPPRWFFEILFKNYFAQRLGINTATVERLPRATFAPFIVQNAAIPSDVLQKFIFDGDTVSYENNLRNIQARTFVIYGSEDTWTPPSLLTTYVGNIPIASGYQLAESGHLPYLEQPEMLKTLIENFLNRD
jgi:pimeloyl-ACP methyl ester carboxylesterase